MFGSKKNKDNNTSAMDVGPEPGKEAAAPEGEIVATNNTKGGFFARLSRGLARTRSGFTENLSDLLLGKKTIDEDIVEEIETLLLSADVGVDATQVIIDGLTQRLKRKQLADVDALFLALREELLRILGPSIGPLDTNNSDGPFVVLMVGINGAGKTTTIGKLAKRLQSQGYSVMLAAGDTFRAAAIEQLQEWGKRNQIAVVAKQSGDDSASVIYDALASAKAKGVQVLIADTAGRLHTQTNLMDELQKVSRVMGKLDPDAPHEVMLVLDAGTGQNAIAQAKQFQQTVNVSSITLTKLDGTAKGGVVFAICKQTGIPIRFIGVGEGIDDMREFNAEDFVDALLMRENLT
jgi:fused signal recognition particle receptor